jgi:hypothetical protein
MLWSSPHPFWVLCAFAASLVAGGQLPQCRQARKGARRESGPVSLADTSVNQRMTCVQTGKLDCITLSVPLVG